MPALPAYFRTKPGRPKYPRIWDGCLGAWCPSRTGCTGGTLYDQTGLGHHGAITNATLASFWPVIRGGVSMLFDGTDDYVRIAHRADLSLSTAVSISVWIYPTAVNGSRIILLKGNTDTDITNYGLYISNGTLNYVWGSPSSARGRYTTDAAVISANTPCHVALTHQTLSDPTIYVNGAPVAASYGLGSASVPLSNGVNSNDIIIGADQYRSPAALFFQGNMDAILLHSRCLTAAGVKQIGQVRGANYETVPPRYVAPPITNLLDLRRRAVVC